MIGRAVFLLGVAVAAGRVLVCDQRIPRPVRWGLAATAVCWAIPGPFDELAILVLFGLVAVFWREPLREAWAAGRASREQARVARLLGRSVTSAPSARQGHGRNLLGLLRGSER